MEKLLVAGEDIGSKFEVYDDMKDFSVTKDYMVWVEASINTKNILNSNMDNIQYEVLIDKEYLYDELVFMLTPVAIHHNETLIAKSTKTTKEQIKEVVSNMKYLYLIMKQNDEYVVRGC